MATIKELADYTNLSIATVSRVLNGKSGIKEETRQRILQAAQELNYRPNLYARSLRSGRSNTIGIITEDLTVFNAPEIIDGIAATCDDAGFHYMLENLRLFKRFGNGPRNERVCEELFGSAVDDLLAKQVSGIIYISCHRHMVVPLSSRPGVKFVMAYCDSTDPAVPSVTYNDEQAAYDLTSLLLRQGDTRIGMITGPVDSIHSTSRTIGHMRALYDFRTPYDPTITLTGNWERDSGYTMAEQLINRGVTAIFAQNDLMAMGVMDYCNEHRIEVGKDLRLVGFDNREIASVCRPSLTTAALPLFEIGKTAAEEMMNLLMGNEPQNKKLLLDCTIVQRDSTRRSEEPNYESNNSPVRPEPDLPH